MFKYNNLSKEELLQLVEKQEAELKTKKYGLVWDSEKEPEQVVLDCENNIPILQRVKEKEIKTDDSDDNILIEGDNYHALTCLNYTHKGKIDVIYIDPPYNTGKAKEWVYNDKFVDENDGYRHSKWLNMMDKRLRLAKNLLSENGVIFINIDHNEFAQLKLVCDNIWGEKNFEYFIWKKKGGAGNTEKILGTLTEFIFCFFNQKKYGIFNYNSVERTYKHKDEISEYNLEGIEKTNLGQYERKTMLFPIIDPKTYKKYFPKEKMRWTLGEDTVKRLIDENKIFFDEKNNKVYRIKRPNDYENTENVFYNLLLDHGSLANAKDELKNIFENREIFDTPKPIILIKHLLQIVSKRNSIILDFFAGSGTTGQAVLELNKEDNGNRKFILCTNNELNGIGSDLIEKNPNEEPEKFGICQRVTYPRLEKVIKGYNKNGNGEFVEGLNGNLQYFKTDLIPVERIDTIRDHQRKELTEKAGQMIAIKENNFEEVETNQWYQIFENKDKSRKTAIYFRENMDEFESLVKKIGKTKTVLYVFSYSRIDKKIFNYLGKNIVLEDIPEPILEIYKEINLTLKDK